MTNLFRFGLCVLCFFVCVFEASAQQLELIMLQMQKNSIKREMRSYWNGEDLILSAFTRLEIDFEEIIDITEEQEQKIQTAMDDMDLHNDPEITRLQESMSKLSDEIPGGPFSENAPPEMQAKFIENYDKTMEIASQRFNNIINENLTPEQKQKIREFQIATMSDLPLVSPDMFEALDLSDEQRKQLKEIQEKLEPEFEKNIDAMAELQIEFIEKVQQEAGDQVKDVTDYEQMDKIYRDTAKKVRENDPEFRKKETTLRETGKAFANKLKFQMFDVLTDEQMERMAQLIDNPPDYIKKALAKTRKDMSEEENNPSGEWKPSLNSWKPGDPIPEEYRKQRQKRFPSNKSRKGGGTPPD